MIHVTRGAEPPLPKEHGSFFLLLQHAKDLSRVESQIRKNYMPALIATFKQKCAYCESLLDSTNQAIDHFKPKRLYPEQAWAWSNLYSCCMVCNIHKRDIDPVDRKSGAVWLLDPCTEDPESFLDFFPDGTVAPRNGLSVYDSSRAFRTIATLGLNRETLVKDRRNLIELLEAKFTLIAEKYASTSGEKSAEFQALAARHTNAEAPFAAAARAFILHIDTDQPSDASKASNNARAITSQSSGIAEMPKKTPEKHCIQSIRLENIGPFADIELEFKPGWNLLLGNNGSGKSTLLRAIAVALAADDKKARPAAPRLLRVGADVGTISLTTDHDEYRSSVARVREEIDLGAFGLSLVTEGRWLTLAFPAMRGFSFQTISGPTAPPPAGAGVHDLVPIFEDLPDPRMDETRQWLVNTALRAEGNESVEIRARYQRIRDWWFAFLQKIMPELRFEFDHLDRDTWQVFVRSPDGIIPIEHLSLGMVSTIGWFGTVLRRLAEAYPDSREPENESAVVLIDEIDAHLHSAWQKRLVPLIRSMLPNIQVIAASHSALITNNLEPDEIIILSRDAAGQLTHAHMNEKVKGLRADQVLTSAAFGLETTRSEEIDLLLMDFKNALAHDDGTPESRKRITQLRAQVNESVSSSPETPAEREALAVELKAADTALRNRLRQATPEELTEIKDFIANHKARRGVS